MYINLDKVSLLNNILLYAQCSKKTKSIYAILIKYFILPKHLQNLLVLCVMPGSSANLKLSARNEQKNNYN